MLLYSVGGVCVGLLIGLLWQRKKDKVAMWTRSVRGWCCRPTPQRGYELVELDAPGNYPSDGNSTTSVGEGTSEHTEGSDSSGIGRTRNEEATGYGGESFSDSFYRSGGDVREHAFERHRVQMPLDLDPRNRLQTIPAYDYMPMVMDLPVRKLSPACTVPQLVAPVLYGDPNETDEELILPVAKMRSNIEIAHRRTPRGTQHRQSHNGPTPVLLGQYQF